MQRGVLDQPYCELSSQLLYEKHSKIAFQVGKRSSNLTSAGFSLLHQRAASAGEVNIARFIASLDQLHQLRRREAFHSCPVEFTAFIHAYGSR